MTDPDAPLRLKDAALIAFPDGGMTASGLRKERDRGTLVVEKMAGKEYTTLNHIQNMRDKCRVHPKGHDCDSAQREPTAKLSGSSPTQSTKRALDAARSTVLELSNISRLTLDGSTSLSLRSMNGTPPKFPSLIP